MCSWTWIIWGYIYGRMSINHCIFIFKGVHLHFLCITYLHSCLSGTAQPRTSIPSDRRSQSEQGNRPLKKKYPLRSSARRVVAERFRAAHPFVPLRLLPPPRPIPRRGVASCHSPHHAAPHCRLRKAGRLRPSE